MSSVDHLVMHLEDLDGPACGRGVGWVTKDQSKVSCHSCMLAILVISRETEAMDWHTDYTTPGWERP